MGGRRWWVLAVLIVALLPLAVDVALVLPALPHLPAGRREQPLIAAAFPLGIAVALPLLPRTREVRRQLLAGLAVALAGCVVEAIARSAPLLLVGRLVVALGAAAALRAGLRAVQTAFDPAEHVRAIAIWAGFTGLGLALAPLIGGALVGGHAVGAIFVLQLPFLVVGLLALAVILPRLVAEIMPEPAPSRDLAGPAAVFALLATAAALSYRLQPDWTAAHVGLLLLAPVLAFSVAARFGATRLGLLAVAGSTAGLALTGDVGLILLIALGIGAALAVSAAPGSPLSRLLAVALGLASAALSPRQALLAAATVSVLALGADLLRSRRGRSGELAPS